MFSNLVLEGGHLEADKTYDSVRFSKGWDIGFVLSLRFPISQGQEKCDWPHTVLFVLALFALPLHRPIIIRPDAPSSGHPSLSNP